MKRMLAVALCLVIGALPFGGGAALAQAWSGSPDGIEVTVAATAKGQRSDSEGLRPTDRATCEVKPWGYRGVVYCETLYYADWDGSGGYDEAFGIGVDNGIWHVWPNAGRWHEMPGGGKAYTTCRALSGDPSPGDRTIYVDVHVNGQSLSYSSTNPGGTAGWNGWRRSRTVPCIPSPGG